MRLSWKLNAIVYAVIFAAAVAALAKEGETRKATFGGEGVFPNLVVGLEADLKKTADEIYADEGEKRTQHQHLAELTQERATGAEKNSLRGQIAGGESEKRPLAEGNDRLGQKLAQRLPARPNPKEPKQEQGSREEFEKLAREFGEKVGEWVQKLEEEVQKLGEELSKDEVQLLVSLGGSGVVLVVILLRLLRRAHNKASAPVRELLRKALVDPEEVGPLVASNATAPQDVDVMVFAPPVVPLREEVIVQVIFHTPDREFEALTRGRKAESAGQALASVPLTIQVRRNDNIKISVECRDATTPEPVQRTVWNGRLVCLQFMMRMPNVEMIIRPKLRVFVNGIPAGTLVFKTLVQQNPPDLRRSPVNETACAFRKPFLSYASEDRVEVLKAAQILNLLKMDYFQDLLNLSPGERWERRLFTEIDNCDVFMLFWSHHAQQSKWVISEAEYARQRAKITPGDGVPEFTVLLLEVPVPSPPASLEDIHFNDPLRHIIFSEEFFRKRALAVE
jgi:hypothetical protein